MSKILVTGCAGFLGKKVTEYFLAKGHQVIGVDLKKSNIHSRDFKEIISDIRSLTLNKHEKISAIIHLASVMNPPRNMNEKEISSIEIDGIKNLIEIYYQYNCHKFIFSSSGAAYGYSVDNKNIKKETDPANGSMNFPYSLHKAKAEKLLIQLIQKNSLVILRPGTILGQGMKGPLYDYFSKKIIIGVKDFHSPFSFIHTSDVVSAVYQSYTRKGIHGTFNLAGDGFVNLKDCCLQLNRYHLSVSKKLLTSGIHVLKKFNLTQYHPYQVDFMCYRPVLCNRKLKKHFENLPTKTSQEVFTEFCHKELTIKE